MMLGGCVSSAVAEIEGLRNEADRLLLDQHNQFATRFVVIEPVRGFWRRETWLAACVSFQVVWPTKIV
jgi:hypothetical protein